MQIIKTIRDKDFGYDTLDPESRKEMRSVRVIILDKDKNILVLHSRGRKYHIFPGGGVNEGEEIVDAAKREVMEETGCRLTNIRELGIVEEYRNQEDQRHQFTYYFVADLAGEIGKPSFEEDELIDNFETLPMSADAIKEILEEELKANRYKAKFSTLRSLVALEEAKKILC